MPGKTATIADITVQDLKDNFELAGYWFYGRWCPSVKRKDDGTYSVRVVKSVSVRSTNQNITFDCFETDADGLITVSPRGWAKDYTKRVRITDVGEVADREAIPDPFAMRVG